MIGYVEKRHIILPVEIVSDSHPNLRLDFVIDTGFTGELTLPHEAAIALGLPFLYDKPINLADGSEIEVPVYSLSIIWQGDLRTVHVFATGTRPLLGTLLLDDWELVVQFREGGLVTVEEI